jgi:hypothetical protein
MPYVGAVQRVTIKLSLLALLAGCQYTEAGSDPQTNEAPSPLAELKDCGVDVSKAELVKEANEQFRTSYVILQEHPDLSKSELSCVAKVLVPRELGLRADNEKIDELYLEPWKIENKKLLVQDARLWLSRNKPNLTIPTYNDGKNLASYVGAIENLCDAADSSVVEVFERSGTLYFPWEKQDMDSASCIWAAVTIGLADSNVQIEIGGVP